MTFFMIRYDLLIISNSFNKNSQPELNCNRHSTHNKMCIFNRIQLEVAYRKINPFVHDEVRWKILSVDVATFQLGFYILNPFPFNHLPYILLSNQNSKETYGNSMHLSWFGKGNDLNV